MLLWNDEKTEIAVRFLRHCTHVDSICYWSSLETRSQGRFHLKMTFAGFFIGILQNFLEELSLLICKIKACVFFTGCCSSKTGWFRSRHFPHIIMCKNISSCDKTAWKILLEKSISSNAIDSFIKQDCGVTDWIASVYLFILL